MLCYLSEDINNKVFFLSFLFFTWVSISSNLLFFCLLVLVTVFVARSFPWKSGDPWLSTYLRLGH